MNKAVKFTVMWLVGFALVFGLTSWIVGEAHGQCQRSSTEQYETAGTCYGRNQTPRAHARHYRRGDYGHAPHRVRYTHRSKRIIIDRLMRKWPESWGRATRHRVWRKVRRSDHCAIPPNKYVMSCKGTFAGYTHKVRVTKGQMRVTFCGTLAALAWIPPEGTAYAALVAGGACGFGFALD